MTGKRPHNIECPFCGEDTWFQIRDEKNGIAKCQNDECGEYFCFLEEEDFPQRRKWDDEDW